jgi:hypothetical protein
MKSINKILLIILIAFGAASVIASCKKDNSGGTPTIKYVRITNPTSSDSLLVGAHQGQLIAIIGENLQDAVEIWFNDQQARLTPTYINKTAILVSVPTQIPLNIMNKLKIIFKNGYVLSYDFQVQINKPELSSMVSEFVNAGDTATIRGNYFYTPLSVILTGGDTVKVVSITDTEIQFIVPNNAQPGPITVKTNFGVTKSDFWFRDNRNVVISSDPYEGWHDPSYVVTNPGPGDPQLINGNYIRVNKKVSSWSWNEIADGDAGSMPHTSKNIPDDAILNPQKYYLKFEVNTMKPYNNGMIRLNIGIPDPGQADNVNYQWKPPYDTHGQWQTVVIPFDEVLNSYTVKPTVSANGYWTRLLIQGPDDWDADISFDTFRVVPKVNQ